MPYKNPPPYISRKSPATKARNARVFLGFAVLEMIAQPGVPMESTVIAAATGLTKQRIEEIENNALRKLRVDPRLAVSERNKYRTW